LARAIGRAASGLGPRYDEFPLSTEISHDLPADLQTIATRELNGPMDLAVVGDIDPDTAAASVATTCAAGNRHSPPRQAPALVAHFEKGDHRWTFVTSSPNRQSEFNALIWPIAEYGRGDRHRHALDLLADVLRVRLSLRLSSPTQRVVPVVVASTGFTPDQFGFFTAAIESSSVKPSRPTELILAELKDLLQDPTLDMQLASVERQRSAARMVRLAGNSQWALVLAEGLSNRSHRAIRAS
jgi:predicted Zn-dependent peptidase